MKGFERNPQDYIKISNMVVLRTIYAVEIDKRRFGILREQVEATHSFCVELINQDALTLSAKQYRRAHYILVDPSCSGSGRNPFFIIALKIYFEQFGFINCVPLLGITIDV